ncbi:MAG: hypothetical protein WBA22_07240 [Candidatus Methanofastidiosia archaeon]
MAYTMLYIWVEGEKDFRFCEGVMTPLLEKKYDFVQIVIYKKKMKKEKVNNYLRGCAIIQDFYKFGLFYIFDNRVYTALWDKESFIGKTNQF